MHEWSNFVIVHSNLLHLNLLNMWGLFSQISHLPQVHFLADLMAFDFLQFGVDVNDNIAMLSHFSLNNKEIMLLMQGSRHT